jgi:hypothetical protein
LSPDDSLEEYPMHSSWKLALIGGEITVLAAFTGIGIHLVMQPHRIAFRPPPLVLPTTRPAVVPSVSTPPVPPRHPSPSTTSKPEIGPQLLRKFGQQDHELVIEQWDILRRLTGAIEHYIEAQVNERFPTGR